MTLFGFERVNYLSERRAELFVVNGEIARRSGVLLRQPKGVAERIYFIFSLPYPRTVPVGNVVLMSSAVCLPVERVGIRIEADIEKLSFQKPADEPRDVGIIVRKRKISHDLHRGVPEPHGGDIPRQHERAAVREHFRRRVERGIETVEKRSAQPFVRKFQGKFRDLCAHDLAGGFIVVVFMRGSARALPPCLVNT